MRDGIAKSFLRFANCYGNGNGEAALAGAAKRAVADDLCGEFHIRVWKNDNVILGAALALHAFAASRRARVNMSGDGSGADKADSANLRMVAEGVDHFFPTVDEVYHSLGQASLFQKLEGAMHREGNALRWLQDESISARDGIREEPVGDHRGEVEGHDGGNDSERLADLHFIHARSYIFEVVALHHHGDTASDFDVFDGAAKFGAGFGEGLAIFQSDDAS